MDLLPLGFLILIVAMSGAIAVLADDLGRRLGKKRLHVRGLRPKRVAQIGTALAGVVVSLVTIIVVASASSGVRQWIAEGRRAIGERNRAIQDLNQATADRDRARAEIESTQRRNSVLLNKNVHLNQQATDKQHQIDLQTGEINRYQSQIAGLRPQVVTLRNKVRLATLEAKRKQEEIDRNKRDLLARRQQLARVTKQLGSVRTQFTQAEGIMKSAVAQRNELVTDNMKLFTQKQDLVRSIDDLKSQISKLEEGRNTALQEAKEAQEELESAQSDLASSRKELASVLTDLSEAQMQTARWKLINDQSRNAPPMYLKGDEVSRVPIEPGLSVAKAQAALQTLLRNARLAALGAGAKPNGTYPEAGIFTHTDSLTGRSFSPEEIEQDIVKKVAGAKEPMVLVAVSSFNAFKGEPVSLEVTWVPNPVVYHRDEIVAETRVDARKDASVIVNEITSLGDKVRQRAREDKMLPKATEDLNESLGQDEIWRLVSDVKRSGGFVRLRAVAEADIRAGDPLKVRFVIR